MRIDQVEVGEGGVVVRAGGLTSALPGSAKLKFARAILEELVLPVAVGREVGDPGGFADAAYRHGRNYKWSGAAFWLGVAHVEAAMWDLRGLAEGRPVHQLVGPPAMGDAWPVYLSSMRRDTSPAEEVDRLAAALAATGAEGGGGGGAVKLKVGGRMSRNADAGPGRSEALVALARRELGDGVTIYADANGSYEAAAAIEVGRMLADHGVAWFEEPVEWEELGQLREVTAAGLGVPVAAGEQECRAWAFEWMCRERACDVVQADPYYNGGLHRTLAVAERAARAGLGFSAHSPQPESLRAALHLSAMVPNAMPHVEVNVDGDLSLVKDGAIALPSEPGLSMPGDCNPPA